MIQVTICSPIPALRAGLSALIASDPELQVAGAAAGLDDLPGPLPERGVIVATPGGIRPADADLPPEMALLLVTADPHDLDLEPWKQLRERDDGRAWGAIAPTANAEALQAAVRALAEGLAVFSPGLLPAGTPAVVFEEDEDTADDHLTEREIDVLRELAQGLTNKQVALALKISEHTVKFHVSSIYSKLGVANRTEAVRKGARRGLIPL